VAVSGVDFCLRAASLPRVNTTLDIPDAIFRQAQDAARTRGLSVPDYIVHVLHLSTPAPESSPVRAWMRGFGQLSHLRQETQRLQAIIDAEFGTVEPTEWK
jgi:hypothetical protein